MEDFQTDDGSVAKFIHDDGSETAIKVVQSCSSFREDDGRISTTWVDRNKVSVFISASLGCYMRCPFCHLTIKDSAYRKLQADQVLANVKEAFSHELARRPEIQDRYVKLCWMGMGDAVNQPDMVHDVTLALLDWMMDNQYVKGLDCVDLSTVLPPVNDMWLERFAALNQALSKYPVNPLSFQVEQAEVATHQHYEGRTPFRVFWSVHSAVQQTRDVMVPGAMPLHEAVPRLQQFAKSGPNLLLHQVFVEGLNDSPDEVTALQAFLATHFPEQELRVLRYNYCDRSPFREWDQIDRAVAQLAQGHQRIKVQVSAGKEVAAACGQFLVARPKSVAAARPVFEIIPDHRPIGGLPAVS